MTSLNNPSWIQDDLCRQITRVMPIPCVDLIVNGLIYTSLKKFDDALVSQVCVIHYDSLSDKSFITSFGSDFLKKLYEMILLSHNGSLLLALDDEGYVKGFILYTIDTSKIFRAFIRNIHLFWKPIIASLLKKPLIFGKLLQTLFYSSSEGVDIKPELLAVAVSEGYRSTNIGTRLIALLDSELSISGVTEYKVTVLKSMIRSNSFYLRLGFQLTNSFNMYGQTWNLYVRKTGK